jgi:hypothetical protein
MDFLKKLFGNQQKFEYLPLLPAPQQEPLHVHQWTERFKTYAPPRRGLTESSVDNYMVLRQLLLGATTVLYECVLCHTFQQVESLGSEKLQLDDILDSVELYGTQYFQRENTTFVIQKYQPVAAQQPATAIPLR